MRVFVCANVHLYTYLELLRDYENIEILRSIEHLSMYLSV